MNTQTQAGGTGVAPVVLHVSRKTGEGVRFVGISFLRCGRITTFSGGLCHPSTPNNRVG